MALDLSKFGSLEDPLRKISEICLYEAELRSMAKPGGIRVKEAGTDFERFYFDTPKGDLLKKGRLLYSELSGKKESFHLTGEAEKRVLGDIPGDLKKEVFRIFAVKGKRRKGVARLLDGSSVPVDLLSELRARNPYNGKEAKIRDHYEARLSGLETLPAVQDRSGRAPGDKLGLSWLLSRLELPFVSDPVKAGFSISEEDDCGTALRRLARKELGRIRGFRCFVLEDMDPEFLHEMRVAARRLRSYLRIFSPVFGTRRSISLSITAASFGLDLGRVRDLDVFTCNLRTWLREIAADDAVAERFAERFIVKRKEEFEILERVLKSRSFDDFLKRIENLSADGAGRNIYSRESFELASLRSMKLFKNEVNKRAKKYFSSPEPFFLHRTRIAFKRYRYLVEILEPFFISESRAYRKTLVEIQDNLGSYQDLKVAERILGEELGNMEEKDALIISGSLQQLIRSRSREEETRFRGIFRDFKRMKDPKIKKGGRK